MNSSEAYGTHLGPYELRGELGRGAMARVWRAFDPNLEREVAIKEPLFDPTLPEETLEEMGRRFVKEGRAAARLNHPNIITIHAADVYDGRPAIVMELIEGNTLGSLVSSGPLPPVQARAILDQLLDAVGFAHAQGVVHRDIKPENIFVTDDGRVKLADFGIAHLDDGSATRATRVGSVLGTPGYMSPEQATGAAIDGRSDLFSVGTVAYEMLTGENPFYKGNCDPTTLLYRIVHEPVPDLPESAYAGLDADLRPAIMAALAKNPGNRPQTAAAFKAMLHGDATQPIPQTTAVDIPATAPYAPAQKKTSWVPYVAVAIAGCALVAVLLATSGVVGGGGAPASSSGSIGTSTSQGSAASASSALVENGGAAASGTRADGDANANAAASSEAAENAVGDANAEAADDAAESPEAAEPTDGDAGTEAADAGSANIDTNAADTGLLPEPETAQSTPQLTGEAFWGVWISGSEDPGSAEAVAEQARNAGFDAHVYATTDWDNLNPVLYYVVSTGECATEDEAYELCARTQEAGWGDAYVKYTGIRK